MLEKMQRSMPFQPLTSLTVREEAGDIPKVHTRGSHDGKNTTTGIEHSITAHYTKSTESTERKQYQLTQ